MGLCSKFMLNLLPHERTTNRLNNVHSRLCCNAHLMNTTQVKAIALGQSAHSNARFEPMGSRNNRLQHELTGLCKQMRGLLRHATAKKKHKHSLCEQSQTLRQQSVLIWQISQDESWAWIWAQQAMTRDALKKEVRNRRIDAQEVH